MSAGVAAQVSRPERDLPLDRAFEQLLVGVLEHEPDRRRQPIDPFVRRGPAVEPHLAGGRPEQPVQVLDQGRLARPVLAQDRHGLAGFQPQRHPAHGLDPVRVAMDEVLDLGAHAGAIARRAPVRRLRGRGRESRLPGRPTTSGEPRDPVRSRPRRTRRADRSRRPRRVARVSVTAGRPTPRSTRRARVRGDRSRRCAHRRAPAVDPSRRGSSGRARRTGSRSRPVPAPRGGRRHRRCRRDPAGPSARRAPARPCPWPRCWRSRPVAARRRTARMARGPPGGRCRAVPGSRRSAGPCPPAGRRGSPARTPAPRERSAWMPTAGWPGSRTRCRRGRATRPALPSRWSYRRPPPSRRAWPGRRVG